MAFLPSEHLSSPPPPPHGRPVFSKARPHRAQDYGPVTDCTETWLARFPEFSAAPEMRKDGGIAPLPALTSSLQKPFCGTGYGHTGPGFHSPGQVSVKRAAYTSLSLLLHFRTLL